MTLVQNRFGTQNMYEIEDICYPIYCESAACLSVYTDFLSWLSKNIEKDVCTLDPKKAKSIIILGCQVTDLAILNDIRIAERLKEENPVADIYMSGCLAQRFDIDLPAFIKRLNVVRVLNQPILEEARNLTVYANPFWVDEIDDKNEYAQGNLFRQSYWMKIGAGCHGKCKYCTIRDTRGKGFEAIPAEQINEFLQHENVVIVSDSPTVSQVKEWCLIALDCNKEISIRNIEPQTANACKDELMAVSQNGLLKNFHCPIQSMEEQILVAMNRSVYQTQQAIELMQEMRRYGTKVATNIIIDYVIDGTNYKNMPIQELNRLFDYWSWNPYFDGNWDRKTAEQRFKKYIIDKDF